ncbi:helix-turn-helix transcriptional regulator [Nocardia sp. CDC153]|uniref:helix-turn-helix transcriptional regulator n=1 Tax=Nocardia sp. CDC153 TaxID=3112167 RepID=UPI002DB64402|nr:helix-turn-helix transcriptional regulator [Nocardia sp. CDC153]MEC3956591.1 helix-turn-helix transcriptional regulator [Nocardia sp. CDC153]
MLPDFAARLNGLFATVRAPGERPPTNGEVAAQLTAWGHPISKPYLGQLRSGQRTDPSPETIAALARFFRVRPGYFADDAYTAAIENDYALLNRLQFQGLRDLSTRAFDLSEESQNLLTIMADRLRITEGLPDLGAGGHE